MMQLNNVEGIMTKSKKAKKAGDFTPLQFGD